MKNSSGKTHLLFLAAILISPACHKGTADSAPDLMIGRDACRECAMIVSEEVHAVGRTLPDGRVEGFDDIGCMCRYLLRNAATLQSAESFWVHDYPTGQWIPAHSTFFIHTSSISTPMGSGLLAFKEKEQAGSFAGSDKPPMTFDDLLKFSKNSINNKIQK